MGHVHDCKTHYTLAQVNLCKMGPLAISYQKPWHTQILTTYSNTNVRLLGRCMMSCSVTMLACFNPLSSEAMGGTKQISKTVIYSHGVPSLIAVNGVPSSELSLISFSATD